jgi:hypothetical protein
MHDDADNDPGLVRRDFLKATGAAVVAPHIRCIHT